MAYSNAIQILGVATRNSAGSSDAFDFGEYASGSLVIHVFGTGGTGARLYPSWRLGYSQATGYFTAKAGPTGLRTVGVHGVTLPASVMGGFHKVSWTLGGTSPSLKFSAYFVGKAV